MTPGAAQISLSLTLLNGEGPWLPSVNHVTGVCGGDCSFGLNQKLFWLVSPPPVSDWGKLLVGLPQSTYMYMYHQFLG